MPNIVVANPYAKKRKAAPIGGPPPSSSSQGSTSVPSARSSYGDSTRGTGSTSGGGGGRFHATSTATTTGDALLPANYAMVPGSFSQAFTSMDETDDFRRASESFETEIRDNKKRESFRLAKVKKGRRSKNKNIFEPQTVTTQADDKKDNISCSLSNRDGGNEIQQQPMEGESVESKQRQGGDQKDNPSGSNINNTATNKSDATATGDVRIHHTMLQPHVLYVSTRQKGNAILPLIRNVPIAYSPMVPDYILGPTSCALFLSIKYHKLYPRYIHRRIAELRKDFKLRVLMVMVDVDDNANTLLQLNTIGVTNQLTVILCWSELEAARYLETFKARDGKDATPIQKKGSLNPLDRVTDFLTGGRAGVNKTDAVTLWNQFSTVSGIASASRDELALVGGMGPVKVRRLHEALHKPFSKLRSRSRKQQQQRQQMEEEEAREQTKTKEIAEGTND